MFPLIYKSFKLSYQVLIKVSYNIIKKLGMIYELSYLEL